MKGVKDFYQNPQGFFQMNIYQIPLWSLHALRLIHSPSLVSPLSTLRLTIDISGILAM